MEIKGLRNRVTIGFISIAVLLFLSGMLSFFELNTLSDDTDVILRTNKRNMQLSRNMLYSLQSQNYAFVRIVAFDDRSLDSVCLASVASLEQTVKEAKSEAQMLPLLDSISLSIKQLRGVTERLLAATPPPVDSALMSQRAQDSIRMQNNGVLYVEYQPIYNSILNSVDRYLNQTQDILAPGAERLHNNAYRAVTPVFISLVVMIAIVLMLYYFMMLYCVNPIVSMNKSLQDFLSFKIPFAPKGECRDEMLGLKEKIETLIKLSKKSQ
ncbi:MAG: hypothetical protein SNG02_04725 [Rikenellaceae bacterium]